MKRTLLILAALMLAAAMLFAGCAKMAGEAPNVGPADGGISYEGKTDSLHYDINPSSNAEPGETTQTNPAFAGRKVIRNADLNIETLDFDTFIATVTERVNSLGGYIQANNMRRGSYSKAGNRYAEMTVRIPAEKLDLFLNEVNGLGNVTWRTENVDDVTDSYTDIEARLTSLRTEYDTLISLLEKAGSLDEIITLQDRLTSVRYEIELYEARKRNYDSLIEMSTVHMNVSEVESVTPVEEESFGQEVSRRFRESFESVTDGLRAFAVWLIGDSPSILLALLVMGLIALVIILIVRGSRKKKEKQREKIIAKTAEGGGENKEA